MHALVGLLVPIIILIAVALIIVWAAERFSPDPFITRIVQVIVFVVVLIFLLTKLLPLLGA
jgi:type IV secretory pathway TrbL component